MSEEERKPVFKTRIPSAAALHTATERIFSCIFCKKSNHTTDECWTSKRIPLEKRKECFLKYKSCFKCAKVGHQSKQCQATCEICQGHHHKTLCPSDKMEEKKVFNTETNVTCLAQTVEKRVILQIAKINVKGKYSEKCINVLFDSGSDRSDITSEVAKVLKLTPVEYVAQKCAVFGGNVSEQKRPIVEVEMEDAKGCMLEVRAVETPVICVPLERPRIPQEILENKGIELKNVVGSGKIKIDMLIGLDNYWRLMSTEKVRVEKDNLVAQRSVFGWILSGYMSDNRKDCVSPQLLIVDNAQGLELEVRKFWEVENLGIEPRDLNNDKNQICEDFRKLLNMKMEDILWLCHGKEI
jgi:hypothetical protein